MELILGGANPTLPYMIFFTKCKLRIKSGNIYIELFLFFTGNVLWTRGRCDRSTGEAYSPMAPDPTSWFQKSVLSNAHWICMCVLDVSDDFNFGIFDSCIQNFLKKGNLTPIGRLTVVKTLLISQLNHLFISLCNLQTYFLNSLKIWYMNMCDK